MRIGTLKPKAAMLSAILRICFRCAYEKGSHAALRARSLSEILCFCD
jgi:hypothetical protein